MDWLDKQAEASRTFLEGVGALMGKAAKKIKEAIIVEVPSANDMDDETFLLHLERRHAAECRIEGYMARNAVEAWVGTYRAFHERLHRIAAPGQHDHVHADQDDEEWMDE